MNLSVPSAGSWIELRQNWKLLLACAIGYGLSLSGFPFYTIGVFVDPLHAAFGWKVSEIQLGLTVSYLTTVAMLPVVAWLSQRLGVRAVALGSLSLLGVAFICQSLQTGRLWTFYLNWFLISLFGTGTLAITWSAAITHAFRLRRGLGLGLSLLGTGVVGIVAPSATRALIDAVGWRSAYVCLGAIPILVAVPIVYLFFHDPGEGRRREVVTTSVQFTDLRLLLLIATFLLTSAGITGVIPNLVKIFTSGGLDRASAVLATSAVGVFVIVGRVACGALIDRFWAPGVAAMTYLLAAAACCVLALGGFNLTVAVVICAMIGLTTGAEFDLMPFLVARYTPQDRFTSSMAVISAGFYVGAAAGGPSVAYFYDRLGSYQVGLWSAATLFSLGAVTATAAGLCRNPGQDLLLSRD